MPIFQRDAKYIIPLFIALILISYFYIDIPLLYAVHEKNQVLRAVASFLSFFTNPFRALFILPVLFIILKIYKKKESFTFLLLTLSLGLGTFISFILKWFFGRARPELLLKEHIFGFLFFETINLESSFPSGHAITAGAIMGILGCKYPRYAYLFLLLALLFSFSRIILEQHYFSDILAGIFVGIYSATFIYSQKGKLCKIH